MSQSKKESFIESATNIAIGYVINLFAQMLIFPIFGLKASLLDNIGIGLCFTVIALTRNYVIRRWFNKKGKNGKS